MNKKLILIFPIAYLLISLFLINIFAQSSPSIIINKLSPHPSAGREIIEIKNISTSDLDITDWYFKDSGQKCSGSDQDADKIIFYKDQTSTTTYRNLESKVLKPMETFDIYTSKKLNDTGDDIYVCKKANGLADNYSDNIKYCKNISPDVTVEKDSNLNTFIVSTNGKVPACGPIDPTSTIVPSSTIQPTISSIPTSTLIPSPSINPTINMTTTPIPTTQIIKTQTPTISPTTTQIPIPTTAVIPNYKDWKIRLNKIYPYTSTGEESVEIFNDSDEDHNLNDWIIDDSKTTSSKFKTLTDKDIIKSHNSLILTSTSSVLNNSGDDVYLISPDKVDIDKFTYTDTQKDGYWEFKNGKWESIWDKSNTTGEVLGTTETITTIKDTRSLDNDSNVKVEGIVTVKPNLLSKGIFYIQDSTSGIRIDHDNTLNITDGDILQITGIVSEIRNEKRIEADKVDFIKHGDIVNPKLIKITDIGESLEGQLIHITGTVSDTNGSTIEIQDKTGKVIVSIPTDSGIKKPYTRTGYVADIIGILSQYGTKDSKPYYRILPRYQDDVKIAKTIEELANTGVNITNFIIFGILILLVLLVIKIKKRI